MNTQSTGHNSYLQWLGAVKAYSFIFAITFGHGGQIRFQKPATANSQTVVAKQTNRIPEFKHIYP